MTLPPPLPLPRLVPCGGAAGGRRKEGAEPSSKGHCLDLTPPTAVQAPRQPQGSCGPELKPPRSTKRHLPARAVDAACGGRKVGPLPEDGLGAACCRAPARLVKDSGKRFSLSSWFIALAMVKFLQNFTCNKGPGALRGLPADPSGCCWRPRGAGFGDPACSSRDTEPRCTERPASPGGQLDSVPVPWVCGHGQEEEPGRRPFQAWPPAHGLF